MKKTSRIIAGMVGGIIIAGGVAGYTIGCVKSVKKQQEADAIAKEIKQVYADIKGTDEFITHQTKVKSVAYEQYKGAQIDVDLFTDKIEKTESNEFVDNFIAGNQAFVEQEQQLRDLKREKKQAEKEISDGVGTEFLSIVGAGVLGGVCVAVATHKDNNKTEQKEEKRIGYKL